MHRCHNCNKTGHVSRDCKEPKAKSAFVVDKAAAPVGEQVQHALVIGSEDEEPRVAARRLPPRGALVDPPRPMTQNVVFGDLVGSEQGSDSPQLVQNLSQEEGISEATLHKWRAQARGTGVTVR